MQCYLQHQLIISELTLSIGYCCQISTPKIREMLDAFQTLKINAMFASLDGLLW